MNKKIIKKLQILIKERRVKINKHYKIQNNNNNQPLNNCKGMKN